MSRNGTVFAIALLLTLAIAESLVIMPRVEAVDVGTRAFLSVAPNPVGVGQKVQVTIWVNPIVPTAGEVFHGFMVEITRPDGTTETKGPMDSFVMGGVFFEYTPGVTGVYRLVFKYLGQTVSTGDDYLPSESPAAELTVRQEPSLSLPESPIPTDYWTRPINSENRGWASIAGNWLMLGYNSTYSMGFGDSTSGFNPYTVAPRSAHVMWTKELALGGLVGGELDSFGYYTGQSYDPYFAPPIILNGRIYYRMGKSGWLGQGYYPGFVCVDLRSGEEYWRNEEGYIDLAQITKSSSFDGQGGIPYLWDVTGSTWDVYDPFTGEWVFAFDGAVSGLDFGSKWWPDAITLDSEGKLEVFILNGKANWFAKWSQAKAEKENVMYFIGQLPATYDWRLGVEWNVTIPNRQTADPLGNIVGPVKQVLTGNVLIAKVTDGGNWVKYEVAYNLTTGEELWVNEKPVQTWFCVAGDGVYASFSYSEMRWTGYDAQTGIQLWISDLNLYPWGSYVSYAPAIARGKLYSGSFDGYMHAFDIKTGKEVWKAGGGANPEIGVGIWPMWSGPIIGANVVFCGTGEETPTQPLTKANRIFAFDAETGEEVWSISGYMSLRAIADGYLVGYNGYDNRIYCFGKGPSATTVTASPKVTVRGIGVLIEGTVTDQSLGTKNTPAIGDEYMSEWMEHVHMQKPYPENLEGVEVILTAIDPNGNLQEIGKVKSDSSGLFKKLFTPDIQGEYVITATFKGSESYGSSRATTAVGVLDASPNGDQADSFSEFKLYLIVATAAITAVIAIVGMLLLRKSRMTTRD